VVSGLPAIIATETIGKSTIATTAATWGAFHVVHRTPASISGFVTRARIAVAAQQTMRVFVVTLNGDGTLTQTATSIDIEVAAGVNELAINLSIAAGQYVGFRCSIAPHHTLGGATTYWYTAAATPIATNTVKLTSSATLIEFAADIEGDTRGRATIGERGATAYSTGFATSTINYTAPSEPDSAGALIGGAAGALVVFARFTALISGSVVQVTIPVATAQILEMYSVTLNSDGTLTPTNRTDFVVKAGQNVIDLPPHAIAAGQYIAIRFPAGQYYYLASGGGSPSHWAMAGGSTLAIGTPFAKTVGNGIRFQLKCRIVAPEYAAVQSMVLRQVAAKLPWAGASWAALGTSITAQGFYTNALQPLIGATLTNLGVGGARLIGSIIPNQIPLISTTAKLVTLECGINDFTDGPTLGAVGDTTTATFYGSVAKALDDIEARAPNAQIVLLTPYTADSRFPDRTPTAVNTAGNTLRQFQQAIVDVGRWLGVPVIDVGRESGVGHFHATTLTSDGLHLNTAGGLKHAAYVAAHLNMLQPIS
jgi:lysophospholipase L1-like esterase